MAEERTLGQLVAQASDDLSGIVRAEIALAKAELRGDVKNAAVGGGMFGAAGYLGLLASITLVIAAAYGLVAAGLSPWLAFLIVAVVLLVLAGILALVGRSRMRKLGPPERTIRTAKDTIAAVKPGNTAKPGNTGQQRAVTVDAAEILVEGSWRHRFVAANGARFHVAEAGEGPLVLLLHGFPEFWWAWRHQLPALAAGGWHAVAMDLRGYGASDKPPRGYDTPTLAADVAGVVRALGAQRAVIVGHDWGGWIAWSMPGLQPRVSHAVAALGMAHPLTLRASLTARRQRRAVGRLLAFQAPVTPERTFGDKHGVVDVLRAWAGPGWPDADSEWRYTRAMQVPFVAHTSMEYYRWAVRSVWRSDGRRFAAAIRDPVTVPVLQVHGGLDPWVLPETAATSGARVEAPFRFELLPVAGHFLPEEAPAQVTSILLDWLASVRPS